MATDEELQQLSLRIAKLATESSLVLTTAESCTGGWIAKCLTDIAGSSAWFDRGLVTYSNTAKQQLLGVPGDLLRAEGAVSEAVAEAMACGCRALCDADLAVAVTGVAGPGGGSAGKPVGTVWFAWATRSHCRTERRRFPGNRESVRRQTVATALGGLIELTAELSALQ